ncbi:hypothetical protein BDA96_06G155500 [Sorghum bicolor]|uniref:S-locus glycoprotein domain-containing protein n=1 Tax=Sorghum bicolor TaxID=4558 RepID=A0A921QTY4_SORBI|nr:hypothetical protein BDA96_06G155500 [Sorghum bicolor]
MKWQNSAKYLFHRVILTKPTTSMAFQQNLLATKNSLDLAHGVYSGQPSSNLTNGHSQILLLWNSSATYWSSRQWNGQYFSNMPQMSACALFTYEVVSNDQEEYFTYRLKTDTLIMRYVLDVSGQAKDMISWSDISEDWIALNGHLGAQCDVLYMLFVGHLQYVVWI